MLVNFFIAILVGLVCFYVYIKYGKYGRTIDKIPGPPGLPIIGHLFSFNKDYVEIWNYLQTTITKYSFAKLWFTSFAVVTIRDPDDLKILLSDKVNIQKGRVYKSLRIWTKGGLLISSGQTWHRLRKLVTPAFHPNIMKRYLEIMSELGESFVKTIKSQGDESVHNLRTICSHLALSTVIEAVMGVKFSTMEDKVEEYKSSINYLSGSIIYSWTRPYIQIWMLRFYEEGRRILFHVKVLCEFAKKVIKERRQYHQQIKLQPFENYVDDVDDSDVHGGGGRKRLAILDLLLQAEKGGLIDNQGIEDEINLFIAAGYDTTAINMVYLLMLLAENKDQQELARAETNRILAASGGKITMTEIQQMEYLERCIKESLRIFPSVPFIVRTIIKDIQLKSGLIPAGTDIFVSIFNAHRDPNYWPDPLKFDPDRFLPEEVQKRHPFAYLPFSHGLRNCIGQRFGIVEIKSFVAYILHNFYLEPVTYTKDLQFTADIILATTESPRIKFIQIKNNG